MEKNPKAQLTPSHYFWIIVITIVLTFLFINWVING